MDNVEKYLDEIGNRLLRLRLVNGYASYEAFANANNLSRMQYWRIEKGKTNLTIKSLLRILKVHNVTLNQLFSKTFYKDFPAPPVRSVSTKRRVYSEKT